MKPDYSEKTTDLSQFTDKLYPIKQLHNQQHNRQQQQHLQHITKQLQQHNRQQQQHPQHNIKQPQN
jgi:hypothetical protein